MVIECDCEHSRIRGWTTSARRMVQRLPSTATAAAASMTLRRFFEGVVRSQCGQFANRFLGLQQGGHGLDPSEHRGSRNEPSSAIASAGPSRLNWLTHVRLESTDRSRSANGRKSGLTRKPRRSSHESSRFVRLRCENEEQTPHHQASSGWQQPWSGRRQIMVSGEPADQLPTPCGGGVELSLKVFKKSTQTCGRRAKYCRRFLPPA